MKIHVLFTLLAILIGFSGCASTSTMQDKTKDEFTWKTVMEDTWDAACMAVDNEVGPSDVIDASYGETFLLYTGGMLLFRGGKYLWSKVDLSSANDNINAVPTPIETEKEGGYLIDGKLLAMNEASNGFPLKTLKMQLDITTGHITGGAITENGISYELSGNIDMDGDIYMQTVEGGKPILEIVGYFGTKSGEGACKIKDTPNVIWKLNQRK